MKAIVRHLGVVGYNHFMTHVPSHILRQAWLRAFGAKIGRETAIFRGTTVLGIENLRIGEACVISFRCLLDARGGLTFGDNVVIASDVQFITAHHDPHSDTFAAETGPIVVEDYSWIASRATVLERVRIGRGAVVAACALVRTDVEGMAVVGGIPAKKLADRTSRLQYRPAYRPLFF